MTYGNTGFLQMVVDQCPTKPSVYKHNKHTGMDED